MKYTLWLLFLFFGVHGRSQPVDILRLDTASFNIENDTTLVVESKTDTIYLEGQKDSFFIRTTNFYYKFNRVLAKAHEAYIPCCDPFLKSFGREDFTYYYKDEIPFKVIYYPARILKSVKTTYYLVNPKIIVVGDALVADEAFIYENALSAFISFSKLK